jgi:short-subunit dehydrogenase
MSVIIIGAGPGLGAAIARTFADAGHPIGLIARRAASLDDLAERLRRQGAAVGVEAADAASPDALTRAIDRLAATLGRPEVLVYNAAAALRGRPSELDAATLLAELQVDVVGALVAANHVGPMMAEAGGGTILMTGGGSAERPWAGMTALGVGKAALRNLARCLAQEVGERGVHVATVTVHGMVREGTPFDPDTIAAVYAQLHAEPRGAWRTEVDYRGG